MNTFVLLRDKKTESIPPPANMYHGSLEAFRPLFESLNRRLGMGVFETINQMNGQGRTQEHVTHFRSLFADIDHGGYRHGALPPTRVVESSPDKFQLYWHLKQPLVKTPDSLSEYSGVETALVRSLGADENAKDPVRVFRVPGFLHQKRPEAFLVREVLSGGPSYSLAQLREAYGFEKVALIDEARTLEPTVASEVFRRGLLKVPPPPPGRGETNGWSFRALAYACGNLGLSADTAGDIIMDVAREQRWDLNPDEVYRTARNASKYAKKQGRSPVYVDLA
jgi:RepB DNA-primase from phage plasmid